jgi:hypothetical protein
MREVGKKSMSCRSGSDEYVCWLKLELMYRKEERTLLYKAKEKRIEAEKL